jgi:hypothetical protein
LENWSAHARSKGIDFMSSLRLVEATPACQAGMVFTASRSSGLHHPLALRIFSIAGVICSLNRQIAPPDLKEHVFGAFVVKGNDDESPPDARFIAEMSWNRMPSLPVSSCAGENTPSSGKRQGHVFGRLLRCEI